MNEQPFMKQANQWLGWVAQQHDVSLALICVCAIFMMILPLPTIVIDVLLSINLSFSLLLLMIAIYLKSPAEFSAFPSVLLMTTLYRLSLTVSTSRLILLQHDAGKIITAFGNFVVGGNLVVGAIIFCIITIVQFIVITKGSERVAEVSARFSLDAMPGKQMSIDGDMRAGTIDMQEAKRLRTLVQQESQLYGAMDGAMKFVKGDAVAGIIVIVVNILGGIAVGVLQHGMSMTQAAATYTVLSIGDGLVSQIPALIISITSGIIVTRVPGANNENLGQELFQQLGQYHGALFTASAITACFGLIPGFPIWAFLILASLFGGIGYWLKTEYRPQSEKETAQASGERQLGAVPLAVSIPKVWSSVRVQEIFKEYREEAFEKTGLPLPDIKINPFFATSSRDDRFVIYLYQEIVCELTVPSNRLLCATTTNQALNGDLTNLPAIEAQAYWIEASKLPQDKSGLKTFEKEEISGFALKSVILAHAKEFLGMQESRYLLEGMEVKYSELVRELQRQIQMARLTDVLQRLIEEQVSIRDLRAIFETLAMWSGKEKDTVLLTEYVRMALHRNISASVMDADGKIRIWNLGDGIANLVRDNIRQTNTTAYSAVDAEQVDQIVTLIKGAIQNHRPAYILTEMDMRRYFKKLIEVELPELRVFSRIEIGEEHEIEILGNIEWVDAPHE